MLITPGAARANVAFNDDVIASGRKRYPYADVAAVEIERNAGALSHGKLTVTLRDGTKKTWAFARGQQAIAESCVAKARDILSGRVTPSMPKPQRTKPPSPTQSDRLALVQTLEQMCIARGMATDCEGWKLRTKNLALIASSLAAGESPKAAFIGRLGDGQCAFAATDRRIIMARKRVTGGEVVLNVTWANVNDIFARRGLMYGTLVIDSLHEVMEVLVQKDEAVPLANDLMQVFHEARSPRPQVVVQQAPPQGADPYEEVKKAKELLDMGILTQEEFEVKKRSLLGL